MKRFEGKNLEEALDAAAAALGVERFRIKYNVVSEKRGFLGGVKRVVIEASVRSESDPAPVEPESRPSEKAKAASPGRATQGDDRGERPKPSGRRPKPAKKEPRVAESVAADDGEDEWVTIGERGEQEAPARPRGERKQGGERPGGEKKQGGGRRSRGRRKKGAPNREEPQVAQAEVVVPEQAPRGENEERVAAWFTSIFELAGFELVVRTSESDENLDVTLYGKDIGLLQQSGGELLDSLQVLANKALAGREMEKRIELDVEAFKKEREERISRKALELAEEVRREGKVRTMRSMTPIERRIVHVTLRDEEGVTTESRGRGFHKRVAILPDDGSSEIEPGELATHSS